MFKTVKGKIVAGVVSVGLLSGVGAAFASVNIADQLQNWYDKTFASFVNTLKDDVTEYAIKKTAGLPAEYDKQKTDTGNNIDAAKVDQTKWAQNEISNATTSRIKDLNAKSEEIKGGMEAQFNQLVTDAQAEINRAFRVAGELAEQDLTNYTSDKGTKARAEMDAELNKAKDQATSDLQKAITSAKAQLQGQLKINSSTSKKKLTDTIDAKISELRALITKKADELLEKEKQLIAERADQDVQAAKDALDQVISGI
ncbi:hypothetical protein [Bacillus sp. FJAT-49736]|uniref:hypothetical protein n=1 Tax=Bacillus sp. FJAT-49736 TaxID=2833582 RepID=UPI001BC932B9|nr:hypothetical protein [Bacillus sp. FJAT-49736]MBS4174335.1 hypothetical protein [Bacillus sp. FJAT-49736]